MPDGEIGGFEHLYREHVNAVFAYALARTTPDLAMETVEETFLVAWRRLDDLPTEPRAWLFGVARRILANQRRARDRRTALGVRIAASRASEHHGIDPAEIVVERDTALVALGRLPEADRKLLCLIAWGVPEHRPVVTGEGQHESPGVLGHHQSVGTSSPGRVESHASTPWIERAA